MPKRVLWIPECQFRNILTFYSQQQSAYLAQDLGIAKDNNAILGTRECDVQTPGIIQETYSLVLITPDTAQNDVILLSSLECINAGYFNLLVQIFLEGAVELHKVDDVGALTLIRGNDADLGRNNT